MRIYFIFFILYEILISLYVYNQYRTKVEYIHDTKIGLFKHTLDSTINTFELSHDDFHSIHAYKVAKLVHKANNASKTKRDKVRKELLKEFMEFYTAKKLHSLEGMHIFDINGYSLLRFHKITKYDDPIIELRESLQKMSKEFSYQKGMDIGVYKESFRFQYPLFYDGEFVGSYEYSVSFSALQKEMKKFFADKYVLLLSGDEVDRVSSTKAKNKRYLRYDSPFGTYYFQEKLFESKRDVKNFTYLLNSENVSKALESKSTKVVEYVMNGNMYDLIIYPLKNIANKDIGYILTIVKNDYLYGLRYGLFLDILFATLLGLAFYMYIVKQIKHRNYVRELINVQEDMLVVTDNDYGIKDANNTMLRFFGYKTLKEFHKDHYCICDFFIEEDGFLQKNNDGIDWLEYIVQNQDLKHRVKMKDPSSGNIKVFEVEYKILETTNNNIFIIFKDITKEYEDFNKLINKANYDSLTNIYNRRSFNEHLDAELENSSIGGSVFSLIMFDIDHFKEINDSYGHDVGDTVLKELTMLVSSHIRESDIFARWGGEEFMIISKNKLSHSEAFSEKIRLVIEKNHFSVVQNITCSFGLTQYHKGDTKESIVKRCDNMLYSAKENGRNSVVSMR